MDPQLALDLVDDSFVEWKFKPLSERYEGRIESAAFLRNWQHMMCGYGDNFSIVESKKRFWQEYENDHPFSEIVEGLGDPCARDARIATIFIMFLGTAAGRCVLSKAEQWRAVHEKEAYLMAWTHENMRPPGNVNHGMRPCEWMLAASSDLGMRQELKRIPVLSARDLEVVDRTALWLGTPLGQKFLAKSQRDIDVMQARATKKQLAKFAAARAKL